MTQCKSSIISRFSSLGLRSLIRLPWESWRGHLIKQPLWEHVLPRVTWQQRWGDHPTDDFVSCSLDQPLSQMKLDSATLISCLEGIVRDAFCQTHVTQQTNRSYLALRRPKEENGDYQVLVAEGENKKSFANFSREYEGSKCETSTEMRFILCTWFGEISSCSCSTVLPDPILVLLNKICKKINLISVCAIQDSSELIHGHAKATLNEQD